MNSNVDKLLFVANVDWFFLSHRIEIAKAAIKEGFEVHLACATTDKVELIESFGIKVHSLPLSRSGVNPFVELKTLLRLYKVCSSLSPSIIHMVTVKPVVYGGAIAKLCRIPGRVFALSGLGFVFIDRGWKARVMRFLVVRLYRIVFSKPDLPAKVIFQNATDLQLFETHKVIQSNQAELIHGSGVNLTEFQPAVASNLEGGRLIVMMVARLLKDKGVHEFLSAAKLLKGQARFVLVGDIDPDNPNSIQPEELNSWVDGEVIEHWGFSNNMPETLKSAQLVVLPSYREGLPRSLIEAAASGIAVVTTNVPGCRDAIVPNETGLLVPVKDSAALAQGIAELLESPVRLEAMGRAGRIWAERQFDIRQVVARHLDIYRQVIKGNA